MKELKLSSVVQGYILDAEARRLRVRKNITSGTCLRFCRRMTETILLRTLSPHTIADYRTTFRKFIDFMRDPLFASMTAEQVRYFLSVQEVSQKTLLNYHTGLSALWTWATRQQPPLAESHILQEIPRPKPEKRSIVPFTVDEVRAMVNAVSFDHPHAREQIHL